MAGKSLDGTRRRARGDGTLEQRSPGVWRLRVWAGRDPITGRPRQASKTVKARTKTIALRELRAFQVEVAQRSDVSTDATMSLLFDRWLDVLDGEGKAPTTLASYRVVVSKHLQPAFGHMKVAQVTAYELERYYRAQQKKGMAARTVRLHHSILSAAFTQAVRWEWIVRSPAPKAKPPRVPRDKKFIPEIDQVRQLIEAAAGDDELVAAVRLAAVTGCRRGELCGLRWSDVDWDRSTLRVERQRVPLQGGSRTVPLKHGEGRTVALSPLGLAVLRTYRATVEARAQLLGVEVLADGWLLSPDAGRTPLRPQTLGEQITKLGRRAKVPVTTHAFRRFAATQMVGDGTDVRTAAGRLGHTPEMLLRVYAGFLPSRDREAAAALEAKVLGELVPPAATVRGGSPGEGPGD